MDSSRQTLLSIDMAPLLALHLKSTEVLHQADPVVRRLDRLIAVGLEAHDYDLALLAWVVSVLKARGDRHGMALQEVLGSRAVVRELMASSRAGLQERGERGMEGQGQGVAGA
jgi:hypothetical protein